MILPGFRGGGGVTPSRERSILIGIGVTAVALRLIHLGSLSSGRDEESTVHTALALLEGWPPTFARGEIYLRGLPFTVLEAGMLAVFGARRCGGLTNGAQLAWYTGADGGMTRVYRLEDGHPVPPPATR